MPKARDIVFVTGNRNKIIELGNHISSEHTQLTALKLEVPEIQHSDVLTIVQEKCRAAFEHINGASAAGSTERAVLVEDTCLNFNALKGLPGPYIKWFVEGLGVENLPKLLAAYEDKSAEAICIYALMEDRNSVVFFRGIARGRIVDSPRQSSWGWDPVFQEERTHMTFAEMDLEMKGRYSHRANAIQVLRKYLSVGQLRA